MEAYLTTIKSEIKTVLKQQRIAPLPIATSRPVNLAGTMATVGFPDISLQGFAPKLAGI